VLELIGTTTLSDSLRREPGIVCMMGMVGDKWSFDHFSPMEVIPTAVRLTTYDGGVADFRHTPSQRTNPAARSSCSCSDDSRAISTSRRTP
jgi:hypothetical protein